MTAGPRYRDRSDGNVDVAIGLAECTKAVPVRHRMDGWTAERQRNFLVALAIHGSPLHAARRVRISVRSAYRLRARPGGEAFARAWDIIVGHTANAALTIAQARQRDWLAGAAIALEEGDTEELLALCTRLEAQRVRRARRSARDAARAGREEAAGTPPLPASAPNDAKGPS